MITKIIKDSLRENLKGLGINVLSDQISLERPANRDHGDWSSNIALVTAKDAGRQARGLAEEIVNSLTTNLPDGITEVTAAGPGFINFRVSAELSYGIVLEVLEKKSRYGPSNRGSGKQVNVEFVRPIPQASSAGHARGACYGDEICKLLSRGVSGFHREFYMNEEVTNESFWGDH
ncbi:MAG: hypothetical protein Ct9H90mP5_05030 [Acidimicrobiaceae bacterium]|nr:MAG: hypothetical protein Ct9H90mP5_05030 [Acidimicrobiaceae bacterium]